jgi:hypothetical protein
MLFHVFLYYDKSSLWQIKLVKCVVYNIIVDISVDHIGGLCTCFLENVTFQCCLVLSIVFTVATHEY